MDTMGTLARNPLGDNQQPAFVDDSINWYLIAPITVVNIRTTGYDVIVVKAHHLEKSGKKKPEIRIMHREYQSFREHSIKPYKPMSIKFCPVYILPV